MINVHLKKQLSWQLPTFFDSCETWSNKRTRYLRCKTNNAQICISISECTCFAKIGQFNLNFLVIIFPVM